MTETRVGKDGRRYNPDRSKWKESMRLRRERLAAAPRPPLVFICRAACFSYLDPPPARRARKGEAVSDKDLPVIPPLPPGEPNLDPNPPVAECGECHMIWRRVMYYFCGNSRCPMQPRITA